MKKRRAYLEKPFAGLLNNQGFTLIETLFALSVFATIVYFVLPLFQIMLPTRDLNRHLQEMEWDVFSNQIKREIHSTSNAVTPNETTVIFTSEAGSVTYEKYNQTLRRQVNGTGHEILLQNVAAVSFRPVKNAIEITVTDLTGKIFRVVAYSFLDWNDSP
ncbi:competence type IV pilus minor pilin ComGF [Neobacillus sp. SM06]|uniref:competence type IV pilus minor pilin ComGF n=1 Tax=Neobacillus sp. SM06 TaxID=3422492 RepID=UPI003D29960F